jgi:cytochrome c
MRPSTFLAALGAVTASLGGTVSVLPCPPAPSQNRLFQARADDAAEQLFNNACRTCHTLREGDNRLGPNLFMIIGRRAGSLPQYDYSVAMKEAGFVWGETNLARFIASPDEVVPGNKMKPYSGLRSGDDAKNVVAFLQSVRRFEVQLARSMGFQIAASMRATLISRTPTPLDRR